MFRLRIIIVYSGAAGENGMQGAPATGGNGVKGFRGNKGTKGAAGDKGARGEPGADAIMGQGIKGDEGMEKRIKSKDDWQPCVPQFPSRGRLGVSVVMSL